MIEAQEPPSGAEARIARARAEFVTTLGRRVAALRNTLRQLEDDPSSRERRDMLQRRVHALAAAARVLGFDGVADALAEAEQALAKSAGGGPVISTDLAEVSRALDHLPSIAWGAKVPSRPSGPPEKPLEVTELGWPLGILVFGPAQLRAALVTEDEPLLECEVAEDIESFRELAQRIGPDVAVIDGDRRGARELIESLWHDPLAEAFPLIIVGTFDHPEAASSYIAAGAARVLPKPVGPDALQRAVLETGRYETGLRGPREPVGDVTVDELATRLAVEIRRGLAEGVEPGGDMATIALGDGTDVLAAVWGAVARIRELVTLRSGGLVRYQAGGPEGAVPLAPWTGPDRRGADRGGDVARRSDGVRLQGRRAVVVDDDPAVVWFLSGLLRTSGVEVAEAHDGLRARDLVFEGLPDVLISDVLMPGLDGFALCHEIKRDVATRDVPVVLLSWKEDLLTRVRELGAGADAYLRKEAAASTVLQRMREVLRPRARIEARLAAGGEVRGRLDGLTTRLVLDLARRHQPNCRVVVRDAVYLYELEMRDGRPRCVTRTAIDGSFERGSRVMDALVGVAAGRFVVAASSTPCRDELGGTLDEVLLPRIRRARAIQHLLDAKTLDLVDAVEIDADAVAGYFAVTPEGVRNLFDRLLIGDSPRKILERDPTQRATLEQLLMDITRHGAVRAVVRAGQTVDLEKSAEPPPLVLTENEASAPPLFTLELSPAPADVSAALARWEQPSEKLPLNRAITPYPPSPNLALTPTGGFGDEPRTNPGVGPPPGVAARGGSPVIVAAATQPAASESLQPKTPPWSPEPAPVERKGEAAVQNAIEPSKTEAESGSFEPVSDAVLLPSSAYPSEREPGEAKGTAPSTLQSPDAAPVGKSTDEGRGPEPAVPAPSPEKPKRREGAPTLPSAKPIAFPRQKPEVQPIDKPDWEPVVRRDATTERAAPKSSRRAPIRRLPAESERSIAGWKIAILTLAAAGLSFAIVSWIRGAMVRPEPTAASTVSAATASAASAAVPKPAAAAFASEELGLPPGVAVGEKNGLLEVEVGDKHAVYVDGTFVGRGPTRRVPIAPGRHDVVVKTPDGETTGSVEVKLGRRTRVTLP